MYFTKIWLRADNKDFCMIFFYYNNLMDSLLLKCIIVVYCNEVTMLFNEVFCEDGISSGISW